MSIVKLATPPIAKVAASGTVGAAMTLLVFAFSQFGIEIPADVSAAVVTLVAFSAGYLTPLFPKELQR